MLLSIIRQTGKIFKCTTTKYFHGSKTWSFFCTVIFLLQKFIYDALVQSVSILNQSLLYPSTLLQCFHNLSQLNFTCQGYINIWTGKHARFFVFFSAVEYLNCLAHQYLAIIFQLLSCNSTMNMTSEKIGTLLEVVITGKVNLQDNDANVIWGLCCQKQVSQSGICNYIPQ